MAKAKSKYVCPITKDQFIAKAKPIKVTLLMEPKVFGPGSFGYRASDGVKVELGDLVLHCNGNFNLTVRGSKPEKTESTEENAIGGTPVESTETDAVAKAA